MIIRDLKNKLHSKKFLLIILFSLILYLFIYLLIKNEFFYSCTQYIKKYIDYYISNYLSGNASDLIFNNELIMYVESDVMNIYSALYLYAISFNNNIFLIFNIFISLYIFHNIVINYHSEIYNRNSILQIHRIGKKKYIKKTILSNCIYNGIICSLPKIIYFLILCIIFPIGESKIHFLGSTSFIDEKFLYVAYSCSPILIIIFDFLLSFLYGFLISYIALMITSTIKNKSLSYILFIFTIAALSIIPTFFVHVPFVLYNSIYNYYNMISLSSFEINVCEPILLVSSLSIILYFITKFILTKRVEKNI